ncbi:LysE family translocator [Metabacillus sp. RGM 3146]|uniref:LysE family translocator n=1 Tax=Metabacillus sp. RGM 3146 TaxID=3401092 RepID=UPI003B9AC8E6
MIGSAFLLYLGMTALRSKPVFVQGKTKRISAFNGFLSSFLLTLTNPMTILTFAAIFGAYGFASESNPLSALLIVSGVFCGSSLWRLLISTGAGLLKNRTNGKSLALMNRISGAAILLFGVFFLLRSLV